MKANFRKVLILFLILLLISVLFSLSVGAADITAGEVIGIFASKIPIINRFVGGHYAEEHFTILYYIRLPRIVLAMLVGAALSSGGAAFQSLLRNPMADPYIIGVSSGAALGATLGIILKLNNLIGFMGTSLTAFLGAIITTFLVYGFSRLGHRVSVTTLLLAGIAFSSLASSLISLLMLFNHREIAEIVFWIMGSFSMTTWKDVYLALPGIFLGVFMIYFYSRELNIMALGEENAQSMGVDIERTKKILIFAVSLAASSSVAVSGIIGFVGLMVPHMVRMVVGPDYRFLIPISVLSGSLFLVLTDTLARTLLKPMEIPVGIITACLGGPFFLYILYIYKRKMI